MKRQELLKSHKDIEIRPGPIFGYNPIDDVVYVKALDEYEPKHVAAFYHELSHREFLKKHPAIARAILGSRGLSAALTATGAITGSRRALIGGSTAKIPHLVEELRANISARKKLKRLLQKGRISEEEYKRALKLLALSATDYAGRTAITALSALPRKRWQRIAAWWGATLPLFFGLKEVYKNL